MAIIFRHAQVRKIARMHHIGTKSKPPRLDRSGRDCESKVKYDRRHHSKKPWLSKTRPLTRFCLIQARTASQRLLGLALFESQWPHTERTPLSIRILFKLVSKNSRWQTHGTNNCGCFHFVSTSYTTSLARSRQRS